VGTFVSLSSAVATPAKSPHAWWVRTFEPPEKIPTAYPWCCGRFWDTLLVSATSSGAVVSDPENRRNHVFEARVGPNNGRDFADWSLLTQNSETSHGVEGTEIWVRFRLYLPRNFKPTGYTARQIDSEWNWIAQLHEAGDWQQQCRGEDPATIALGIVNRRTKVNPRFRLLLKGGVQSGSRCVPRLERIEGPAIRLRHWYNVVERIILSPSDRGLVRVWIDGKRMANAAFPTVYRHPNGTVGSYYVDFGYYRLRASWDASVLLDDVAEGPSRRSVLGKN
jgi:hypothetical protein